MLSFMDHNEGITISVGMYENRFFTKEECIELGDRLLYIDKRNGRNRIEV